MRKEVWYVWEGLRAQNELFERGKKKKGKQRRRKERGKKGGLW